MAVSRDPGNRSSAIDWLQPVGRLSWYDVLLAVIPVILTLPVVASVLVAVPMHHAVGVAGAVDLLLVVDALFVHSPVDSSTR